VEKAAVAAETLAGCRSAVDTRPIVGVDPATVVPAQTPDEYVGRRL